MQEKKPDDLKRFKLLGLGIVPTMMILFVIVLVIIYLYESNII